MKKTTALLIFAGFGIAVALLGSVTGVAIYQNYVEKKVVYIQQTNDEPNYTQYASITKNGDALPDLVGAVERSRPAVVHIKSTYESSRTSEDLFFPFRDFFGDGGGGEEGLASGSGVIISEDGYIVTNNHVVEDASAIEVVMTDNRTYKAEVIGTDRSTDLALLKIEEGGLPFLAFGNSDQIKIGEWVLAVGNPMNLTSTVTAGIISAKGRNINLLRQDSDYAIESFIQTDAAVNPGNSGGALVNLKGDLVGINTAIASRTGTYTGYSFAIPAAIVKKVTEDLLLFGSVQRGFLGVTVESVNATLADERDLFTLTGAYVTSVNNNSGADDAGLNSGDVIVAINDMEVKSTPELLEQVSRYRPGDILKVTVMRDKAEKVLNIRLKGLDGTTSTIAKINRSDDEPTKRRTELLGSSFHTLSSKEQETLGVEYGVVVERVGSKLAKGGVQRGFVITDVNGRTIQNVEDLEDAFANVGDFVSLKGMYDRDKIASYSFSW